MGGREYQAEFYDATEKGNVEVMVEDEKTVVYADGEKLEPQRIETYDEGKITRQSSFSKSVKNYLSSYSSFLHKISNTVKDAQNPTT